jgi:Transposase zinc-ribbon domain
MPSHQMFFAALGALPAAVALLTALRWPDGVTCPHCGSAQVGGHGRYERCPDLRAIAVRRAAGPSCSPPARRSRAAAFHCPIGW